MTLWHIEKEWQGETVFIIAGGPSVTQEAVDRLRGRKVIVVNSSYQKAPWAPMLVFNDRRWWVEHKPKLDGFAGRIVTTSPSAIDTVPPRLLRVGKQVVVDEGVLGSARAIAGLTIEGWQRLPVTTRCTAIVEAARKDGVMRGLAAKSYQLTFHRTTLTTAVDLAVHLGGARLVILGGDLQAAADGRTHHHAPHKWVTPAESWQWHRVELAIAALALAALGVEVINCSPTGRLDFWRHVPVDQFLDGEGVP